MNLISRSDHKQPITRKQNLKWPGKQHAEIAPGDPRDLNASMPWNLQLSQGVSRQAALFAYFDRFKPDFVQQIRFFSLVGCGIKERADMLNLRFGSEH